MKKGLFVIIILIACLFISSCSCRKSKLDYIYVGLYTKLIDVEKPSMDDRNPKLYYNIITKNLVDSNQIYEYQISTSSINKNIYQDGETMVYDIACLYSVNVQYDTTLDEANVYPIVYDGNEYRILDTNKTIKIKNNETTSVSFRYAYYYEKDEYAFKATIKILKKEM